MSYARQSPILYSDIALPLQSHSPHGFALEQSLDWFIMCIILLGGWCEQVQNDSNSALELGFVAQSTRLPLAAPAELIPKQNLPGTPRTFMRTRKQTIGFPCE